jgi:hypothetical protein
MAVSAEALKTFAATLEALEKPLADAREHVSQLIIISPGACCDVPGLAAKVNGVGLEADPMAELLRAIIEAAMDAMDMVAKAKKVASDLRLGHVVAGT